MMETVYDKMGLPPTARLGKRIYKRMFHENTKLSTTDKKALSEDVETITWAYTLKPSTIPIKPYVDEQQEYVEIAIIQVNLKSRKRASRLAEIIHRAIPYPVVLMLSEGASFRLSLAPKRFSEAAKGAIVADDFFSTDWIELSTMNKLDSAFVDSLAVASLPHTDFRAFYTSLVERVVALDCASRTSRFRIEDDIGHAAQRRATLVACQALEAQISEERTAMSKSTQISRKAEGNLRIQQMRKELEEMVALL